MTEFYVTALFNLWYTQLLRVAGLENILGLSSELLDEIKWNILLSDARTKKGWQALYYIKYSFYKIEIELGNYGDHPGFLGPL